MAKVIGLDTVIFIYLLEEHPKFLPKVERALRRIQEGRDEGVFSCIGMIELMTGPKQKGRLELAARYRELLSTFLHLTIWGITENIIEISSDLRSRYGITTPDAIHLATAINADAEYFLTNDRALKRVKEVKVKMLTSR